MSKEVQQYWRLHVKLAALEFAKAHDSVTWACGIMLQLGK